MEQDTSYYDYEYIEFQPKELYLKLLTFFEPDVSRTYFKCNTVMFLGSDFYVES